MKNSIHASILIPLPDHANRARRVFCALAAAALLVFGGRAAGASAAELHGLPVISIAPPSEGVSGAFASGGQVRRLENGNVVVVDTEWGDGVLNNVGAVYLYDGVAGELISRLTGQSEEDYIGSDGILLLDDSNFLILSSSWNGGVGGQGDVGAATWINGFTGLTGVVSVTNSLVGTANGDQVGWWAEKLTNGNYVVQSNFWHSGTDSVGAVTWASPTGITGVVSIDNSLVGTHHYDGVGAVYPLKNGNYFVRSGWRSYGAMTWVNGATGMTGTVNESNSMFGSATNDNLGNAVYTLENGSAVATSWAFNGNRGAVMWLRGDGPTTGTLSTENSLVGAAAGEYLPQQLVSLPNGDYVVCDPAWNEARGAVIWGSGTGGVTGTVSEQNAMVGANPGASICDGGEGGRTIFTFPNGKYAIVSPGFDTADAFDVGAVTIVDPAQSITGVVTTTNSLYGLAGSFDLYATPLSGTKFLVSAPGFEYHGNANAGAVVLMDAAAVITGPITTTNSLYGTHVNDYVGAVAVLDDGNFVASAQQWDSYRGLAHWASSSVPAIGELNATNSMVGECADQRVGSNVTALKNGRYVIGSYGWERCGSVATDLGAVTWMEGGPATGIVSVTNSIVGDSGSDKLGDSYDDRSVALHASGDWSVIVPAWDRGGDADVGALLSLPGDRRVTGTVAGLPELAIYGLASGSGGDGYTLDVLADDQARTIVSWWENDKRVYLSRALWPSLVASTVGVGTIAGGGLDCGVSCTVDIHYGTPTELIATSSGANEFVGWSGACSGAQTCTLPMTTTVYVTATFEYRAELADANLSDLTLSDGVLTPAFVSSTMSYTAAVGADVSSVTITPTTNYTGATYTMTNASGVCAANACAVDVGANSITVTVTAADGVTTQGYVVVVTRAAVVPMLSALWPRTGIPAGGMPVTLLGMNLSNVMTVEVGGVPVISFTITGYGRIDFVMPPGTAGDTVSVTVRTAEGEGSLDAGFHYEEEVGGTLDASVGGVITTTSGVTLTIPMLPVSGTLHVMLVPVAPPTTTNGSLLLYSFVLSATLDGQPLQSLAGGILLEFTVEGAPTGAGEQPWVFEQQSDGTWGLFGLQHYSASTGRLSMRAQSPANYAVTVARWFRQRMPYVTR